MIDAMAIDCCWFVECGDDPEDFTSIIQFLALVDRKSISLLFDHENRIEREYRRHVVSGLGRNFIKSCLLNGRVQYFSGSLKAKHEARLDAVGFDPSDRPYLGVAAAHGDAPYVTTEEKHLHPIQARRIQEACGVSVLGTQGALELLT